MRSIFSSVVGLFLFSFSVWALPVGAPPSFQLKSGEKLIFIDFVKAEYRLLFDAQSRKTRIKSDIYFQAEEAGFPLFDLVANPLSVSLDDEEISQKLISDPTSTTRVRVALKEVEAGNHHLQIVHELEEGVSYSNDGVRAGFFFSDLDDRQFLELYLPANLEFDAFTATFFVQIKDSDIEHTIFTNGRVQSDVHNIWKISFPSTYTTSSFFFHLAPKTAFNTVSGGYTSQSGKQIPILVYGRGSEDQLTGFRDVALETLAELDSKFGTFAHDKLVVYASPEFGGGMEHCGATITSLRALSHEITHSYFGRSLMPANGNSGWMDEALASWRDGGYPNSPEPGYDHANMAHRSPYIRLTTTQAYSLGMNFMSYMDYRLQRMGTSLEAFLKNLHSLRPMSTLTTSTFQDELFRAVGSRFEAEFNQWVYGLDEGASMLISAPQEKQIDNDAKIHSPFHERMTPQKRRSLL